MTPFNPYLYAGLSFPAQRAVRMNYKSDNTLEKITSMVFAYYGIPYDEKDTATRTRELVSCRQVAIYLCRTFTDKSLKQLGKFFGNRDHSTIVYALQTVQNLIDTDKNYAYEVNHLHSLL